MALQYATRAEIGLRAEGERYVRDTMVTGGGGVQLHVVETGNPHGRPIVFIHGFSQCWLSWSKQLCSDLADHFRLVAMDMRGHGLSEKPDTGYTDARLWADDLNAVIRSMDLEAPVLSGWSYGPLVILDYLRHYGESQIGGINFVAGITKLGSDDATAVLSPQFIDIVPGLLATDAAESVQSLKSLLRLCFVHEPSPSELFLMLGYNAAVPPYVRQALFSRSFNNDDLLQTIRTPVLITHGARDAIVKPSIVEQHRAAMPHAHADLMPNAGHSPFWDDAPAFNQHLRAFCQSL